MARTFQGSQEPLEELKNLSFDQGLNLKTSNFGQFGVCVSVCILKHTEYNLNPMFMFVNYAKLLPATGRPVISVCGWIM